ncbi:MAG: DNA primase [Alphaproteobacteria bacterium]|nr:DNA primase [Alphaproteobacteria bacterium]
MSLPPGFLDELRTRSSLAQVVGRKVIWDAKKTNQGKGDYWAPCPFHQEKTASFHLDDRKGYYYCFGCHAKGDALNFIRETENVGFMEAVEILAREAGMPMPARDPQAQQKADQRSKLVDVMEAAVQYYRLQLNTAQGTAAREYLNNRGLTDTTQAQFEIGFAPDNRKGLFQHLSGKGIAPELIVEAGLAIKPDDGGAPFDRFRGRIIFPIRDIRKRAIAFGGRAMDPNARAKYLNSPETPLFDKGRTLYNHAPAREAAGKAQSLIVAEGYIALAKAGFAHAVAPLGTAITEDQLLMIWRLTPEPIIALDGDKAGLRAAMRLIDIALPLLEAGRSLRFCLLPEGLDPDDLIKSQGRGTMQKLLENAEPMVKLLWQREVGGRDFDSPERRATLDASLRTAIGKIRDTSIRNHYVAAIKDLRAVLFKPKNQRQSAFVPWKKRGPELASAGAKSSMLAQGSGDTGTEERLREAVILATCINHPEIVAAFETPLERLHFTTAGYSPLRDAILRHAPDCENVQSRMLRKLDQELGPDALEKLMSTRHLQTLTTIQTDSESEVAKMALAEELAKLEATRGARTETDEAMQDMTGLVDEGLTWRLQQATDARHKATRTNLPEGGTEDEDRENMSKYLQNLIDGQVWVKKKQ